MKLLEALVLDAETGHVLPRTSLLRRRLGDFTLPRLRQRECSHVVRGHLVCLLGHAHACMHVSYL